jgi:hypothetical protein
MLTGAIVPELLAHRLADRAARHQQWQLGQARNNEASARKHLLTCNPYLEIARLRADRPPTFRGGESGRKEQTEEDRKDYEDSTHNDTQ